jgi:hypothetical protein
MALRLPYPDCRNLTSRSFSTAGEIPAAFSHIRLDKDIDELQWTLSFVYACSMLYAASTFAVGFFAL